MAVVIQVPPTTSGPSGKVDKNFGVGEKTANDCRAIRSRLLAQKPKKDDAKKYETCAWKLIAYCTNIPNVSKGSIQTESCYHQLFGVEKCTSDRGSSAGCVAASNVTCMKQVSKVLISACLASTGVGPGTTDPITSPTPGGGGEDSGGGATTPEGDDPAGPEDEGEKAVHPLTKQHSVCDKDKDGSLAAGDEQSCARKLEQDKCAQAAFGPLKDLTCSDPDAGLEGNSIVKMLKLAVKVTAVGVGIIISGVLGIAGIQYASARGNPQAIAGAKTKILAALGGLAIYLLFAALVNFLIPGGIIG